MITFIVAAITTSGVRHPPGSLVSPALAFPGIAGLLSLADQALMLAGTAGMAGFQVLGVNQGDFLCYRGQDRGGSD